MKILALSDIHERYSEFTPEKMNIAEEKPDIILAGGDVTNYGLVPGLLPWFLSLAEYAPVFWIPGNHDIRMNKIRFKSHKNKIVNILGKVKEYKGIKFVGASMSPGTVELAKRFDNMTANINAELAYYENLPVGDVILSHCPPVYVLDTVNEKPLGSLGLAEYILKHKPKLVVCGHIHEHGGKVDRVQDTEIVNVATKWKYLTTT
jgi:Icc-related predicted phosphoesterase